MQDGYHIILVRYYVVPFFWGLVGGSRYGYLSDYGWHAAFGLILHEQSLVCFMAYWGYFMGSLGMTNYNHQLDDL